ncbi:cell elongation-specific peptidoglycan D,D-transpeptidase [Pseudarthrobacter equi]|uniref:Cell elongation-specific peptidoglycan D,D-transpeptidase n=1 Tax=Pseudarthrobacter equi TaxID=728066 RepID=A0A1H1T4M7_9MICC|nr:penicillin-binding protein 2 [Pseudarthrobacter equi]SDS55212.1 cell elongation-specific peptidoglycan D,D-transpeptidase [Pseudarthrobacter equi]
MNQAIRHSWIAAVAMFALLFGALSFVQVVGADELKANPLNQRAILQNYCSDRGAIIVGGTPVAESVETGSETCKFQRTYPQPELYAGMTGYFSQNYGATGLERAMGEVLTGDSDQLFLDRVGQLFLGNQPKGASVELTIDPQLQQLAYSLIPDGQRGSIVVTNPKTGAILAMASKPSYDPNKVAVQDPEAESANINEFLKVPGINLNQNVSGPTGELLAPGSVYKLVDTAAALASGKYNADSVLPNPAEMPFDGISYRLPNYAGGNCYTRDTASFAFALQQSCNTPFASIALDLGRDAIASQAQKFGFGEDLGDQLKIGYARGDGFPNELDAPGLAQSAIGQKDVRATPLQINMMTSAIANDGVQMRPSLIKTLRSPDLRVIDEPQPEQLRTSTTPEIANQITDWMVSAVSEGIANRAGVPGVQVAGKTGTAELGNGTNNSWFTGFAPANNPQVSVTIAMEGVDITTGAQLTSPNAKKIFEAVLNK